MRFTRITVDPIQMAGMPCIRDLRIPVGTVVSTISGRGLMKFLPAAVRRKCKVVRYVVAQGQWQEVARVVEVEI